MTLGDSGWLVLVCLGCGVAGGVWGAWLFKRRTVETQPTLAEATADSELAALRTEVDRLARRLDAQRDPAPAKEAWVPAPGPTPAPRAAPELQDVTPARAGPVGSASPAVPARPTPTDAVAAPAPTEPAESPSLRAQEAEATAWASTTEPARPVADAPALPSLVALSDEEIDALPADLPAPTKPRRRVMPPPRKPTFDRL